MGIFNKTKPNKKQAVVPREIKKQAASKIVPKELSFLLKQAWITEKSGILANSGKYVFIVDKNANKPQIKKAVEAYYGVKISSINIVNQKPKSKRFGRSSGVVSGNKKAIVSLKEGKIDLMPA
ncbi:50S ribosomal protein L23 [Candidatus Wolfebacteria bacterium]|nr:50S ribosomal protein L23 [Candidatus Wolfebacteria bacterium]